MQISRIKSRAPIIRAIREYDRLGRENFLEKYGFGSAKSYWLAYRGRRYDSKAIIGAACAYLPNSQGPLKNTEFYGGDEVRRLLEKLGFEVEIGDGYVRDLETELQRVVWLRKNQTKFSDPVKSYWRNRCAVTGIEAPSLLEACHVKPGSESDAAERLNPFNGLYLASHIHTAFDANLIGISPDGIVSLSDNLSASDRKEMHLSDGLKIGVDEKHRPFLKYRYAKIRAPQNRAEGQSS